MWFISVLLILVAQTIVLGMSAKIVKTHYLFKLSDNQALCGRFHMGITKVRLPVKGGGTCKYLIHVAKGHLNIRQFTYTGHTASNSLIQKTEYTLTEGATTVVSFDIMENSGKLDIVELKNTKYISDAVFEYRYIED